MASSSGTATPVIVDNSFRAVGASRGGAARFLQDMSSQLQVATPGDSVSVNTVVACAFSNPVGPRVTERFVRDGTSAADRACVQLARCTADDSNCVVQNSNDGKFYHDVSQTTNDAIEYVFFRDGRSFTMTVSDATRQPVAGTSDNLVRYQQTNGGPGAIYRSLSRVIYCADGDDFSNCETFVLEQ